MCYGKRCPAFLAVITQLAFSLGVATLFISKRTQRKLRLSSRAKGIFIFWDFRSCVTRGEDERVEAEVAEDAAEAAQGQRGTRGARVTEEGLPSDTSDDDDDSDGLSVCILCPDRHTQSDYVSVMEIACRLVAFVGIMIKFLSGTQVWHRRDTDQTVTYDSNYETYRYSESRPGLTAQHGKRNQRARACIQACGKQSSSRVCCFQNKQTNSRA